jgi:hypothetical protein
MTAEIVRSHQLQSWLELNRTDRRRVLDDAKHGYAAQCQAPASGEDNTVTTVGTLRDKPTHPNICVVHDIGIDGREKLSSAEVADQDDVAGGATAGHHELFAVC